MDFDAFKDCYKPHVRPPDMVKTVEEAFRINAIFREEFGKLKPYLPAHKSDWGDHVVDNLLERGALDVRENQADIAQIRGLYRHHSVVFRAGRFGVEYLDSIETIALFFAFRDVKTLWIASAYNDLTRNMIDYVYDRERLNQRHSARTFMRALTGALALELNQIQRTFTMYEKYVSDALVKDLTFAGMLTGGPNGLAAGRGQHSNDTE